MRLYEFRGEKVMLDSDLAENYGYETKNFKRQVKNNIAKFEGDDFMFELNDVEVENLSRCKNFTLNMGRGSNIKYKPYVFTEQGVYMLMTVLRGELAIKQSRALVKTFKKMKDYILENRDLIGQREILQLSMETANNRIEINKINSDMISLEKQISDVAEGLKDVVTKSELADRYQDVIGQVVRGKKDRSMGSCHPRHKNIFYPVNYGYVTGITGENGAIRSDVNVLGDDEIYAQIAFQEQFLTAFWSDSKLR